MRRRSVRGRLRCSSAEAHINRLPCARVEIYFPEYSAVKRFLCAGHGNVIPITLASAPVLLELISFFESNATVLIVLISLVPLSNDQFMFFILQAHAALSCASPQTATTRIRR